MPLEVGRATADDRVDVRRAVIDAATRVLAEQGLRALSVRRIAQEVGASTMVVYTHFGDKDGVVSATLDAWFDRFATALHAVHDDDPWLHLRQLGHAYRKFANEHPNAYQLLFGGSGGPREPTAASRRAFDALSRAIGRVLADLDRSARDIDPIALDVWSATHGMVSLELAGACANVPDVDASYEHLFDFIEAGIRGLATR
jgi:AcrR family transcriptional regulator